MRLLCDHFPMNCVSWVSCFSSFLYSADTCCIQNSLHGRAVSSFLLLRLQSQFCSFLSKIIPYKREGGILHSIRRIGIRRLCVRLLLVLSTHLFKVSSTGCWASDFPSQPRSPTSFEWELPHATLCVFCFTDQQSQPWLWPSLI